MTFRTLFVLAGLLTLVALKPVSAHHGWSGYDSNQVLTLEGKIDKLDYSNPHVMINLKTTDKTWHVVLAPIFRMENRGLPSGALKEGLDVTVVGYPNKTETSELRAERIVVAGKTIELR